MGALLSILKERKPVEDNTIKIVLIGLENAGKTTFLFVQETSDAEHKPTVGFNMGDLQIDDISGVVFDIGGKSKELWSNYVPGSGILIFMVDASDRSKFSELHVELKKLAQIIDKSTLLIFLLNKIDKNFCFTVSEFIEEFRVDELFSNDLFIHRVSAKRRRGFEKLMSRISHFLKQPKILIH